MRQEFERHRYVNQLKSVDVLLFQSNAEFQVRVARTAVFLCFSFSLFCIYEDFGGSRVEALGIGPLLSGHSYPGPLEATLTTPEYDGRDLLNCLSRYHTGDFELLETAVTRDEIFPRRSRPDRETAEEFHVWISRGEPV